jgi:hypothetical protein
MIVFLDIKNQQIKLYSEKGMKIISFSDINILEKLLGGQKVLYITNAILVDPLEIVKTVKSIYKKEGIKKEIKNEPLFVRSKKGHIHINELDFTFGGPTDFCPLKNIYEKFGNDIFEKNKTLKHLLDKDFVEIITLSEVQKIQREQSKEQEKIDQQLDSIIVGDKVDKYIENVGNNRSPGKDAIDIEIDSGPTRSVGGGTSNEGSLLPDDF